jgi:hypothetical protein
LPASHLPRPRRTLLAGLALALSLSVLGLAASTPALAKAHRSACRHSTAAHAKRHGHACAKSPHKAKVHARHGGKRHGAQPAVTKAKTKTKTKTKTNPQAPAKKTSTTAASQASSPEPASCEDGSSPLAPQDEVYECEDGSDPGCEAGSEMTVSSDGSKLLCSALPQGDRAGEAECEAGTVASEGSATPAGLRRASTLVCSTSSEATDPTAETED